jgi:hypothetical protein
VLHATLPNIGRRHEPNRVDTRVKPGHDSNPLTSRSG